MTEYTAIATPIAPVEPGDAAAASENQGKSAQSLAMAKLRDALVPGFEAEFSPEEAEAAGAFREDALSVADASDSVADAQA